MLQALVYGARLSPREISIKLGGLVSRVPSLSLACAELLAGILPATGKLDIELFDHFQRQVKMKTVVS